MPTIIPGQIRIFVDGPNLFSSQRILGFKVDARKLLNVVANRFVAFRPTWYDKVINPSNPDPVNYDKFKRFITKAGWTYMELGEGGDVDPLIHEDLQQMIACPHNLPERIALVSADGGYIPLLKQLRQIGVGIYIYSNKKCNRSYEQIFGEEAGCGVVDIQDLKDELMRIEVGIIPIDDLFDGHCFTHIVRSLKIGQLKFDIYKRGEKEVVFRIRTND